MPEASRRPWLKITLAVPLVFIFFLLLTAPARLLPPLAGAFLPQLQLQHASGTLWRGSVASAAVNVEGSVLDLGRLSWRFNPLTVLALKPAIEISTEAPSHQIQAGLSLSLLRRELQADAVQGFFPISLLEPWVPLVVRGRVELDIEHIALDDKQLRAASGRLFIEQLDWLMGSQPMPLGTYVAELSEQQGGLRVDLSDRQAQLGVDGNLTLNPAGAYQLQMQLQLTDQLAPEIRQGVAYMGSKNAQGDVLFSSQGRWR